MTALYLHVGMPKCGTTALQNILHESRETLKKSSILYPLLRERDPFHHQLYFSLMHDPEAFEKHSKKIINESHCYQTVILSSENFSWNSNINVAQKVHDRFSGHYENIKIVIYFRNIYSYLNSWYSEHIQSYENQGTTLPSEFLSPSRLAAAKLPRIHNIWATVFGAENIITKIYDKNVFKETPIEEDFLSVINPQKTYQLNKIDRKHNVSLNYQALLLKRHLNSQININNKQLHNGLKVAIVKAASNESLFDKNFWLLSNDHILQIEEAFKDDFEKLKEIIPGKDASFLYAKPEAHLLPTDEQEKKVITWIEKMIIPQTSNLRQ